MGPIYFEKKAISLMIIHNFLLSYIIRYSCLLYK